MAHPVTSPPRTMLEAFKSLPEGTLVQLINNQLIMAAAPLDIHQQILGDIFVELSVFVKRNSLGQTRVSPYDVYFSDKNIFQPDICFIANENLHKIQGEGLHGAPDLVIELLSPSTSKYDLDEKKDVYERYGVKEYFIIEPLSKSVTHYWLLDGQFQKQSPSEGVLNSKLLNCTLQF
jgi:Uma2 family endonuclease